MSGTPGGQPLPQARGGSAGVTAGVAVDFCGQQTRLVGSTRTTEDSQVNYRAGAGTASVYGTTHHVTQCQLCLSFEMPRFARTVPTHGGGSRRALREGPGSWAGRGHSVPFTGCLAEFAVINHTLPSSCLFLSSLHPSPTPSLHSPKQLIQSFPCRVGTVEGSPPAITTVG